MYLAESGMLLHPNHTPASQAQAGSCTLNQLHKWDQASISSNLPVHVLSLSGKNNVWTFPRNGCLTPPPA